MDKKLFNKTTCDKCNIKKPNYLTTDNSFTISYDTNEYFCSNCYKEKKLKSLFDLMDCIDKEKR